MNPDNHITGRNITDDPNSPYYTGKDFSKAIFCPICRKYFLDGVKVQFENIKGLLCDEELCEGCEYYEIADKVGRFDLFEVLAEATKPIKK